MRRLLILGGTGEATKLAIETQKVTNLRTIYSLAGRTNAPNIPLCEFRTGGFGGINGLIRYLQDAKIDFVIDATHPFADQMASNVAKACTSTGIPRIKFCRPAWEPNHMPWISVPTYSEAANQISLMGQRVFLSIGINKLNAFSFLSQKWFLIRAIEIPIRKIPLANHDIILGRGPFTAIHEQNLFTKFGIEVLVSKNSGGVLASKLKVAERLQIPTIMIEQPLPPKGRILHSIEETLDWLRDQP